MSSLAVKNTPGSSYSWHFHRWCHISGVSLLLARLTAALPSLCAQPGIGDTVSGSRETAAFHSCLMGRQGEKEVGSEKEQALSILANIYLQYNTAEPCLVITFMLRPSHLVTARSGISGSSQNVLFRF